MENRTVEYEKQDHNYCLRCGRRLKNPIARERGYGLVCERKMRSEKSRQLFTTSDGVQNDMKKEPI